MNFIKKLFNKIKHTFTKPSKADIRPIKLPSRTATPKITKGRKINLFQIKEAARAYLNDTANEKQKRLLEPFLGSKDPNKDALNVVDNLSNFSKKKLKSMKDVDIRNLYSQTMSVGKIDNIFGGLHADEFKDFLEEYNMTVEEFIANFNTSNDTITTRNGDVISFKRMGYYSEEDARKAAEEEITNSGGRIIDSTGYYWYLVSKRLNVRMV